MKGYTQTLQGRWSSFQFNTQQWKRGDLPIFNQLLRRVIQLTVCGLWFTNVPLKYLYIYFCTLFLSARNGRLLKESYSLFSVAVDLETFAKMLLVVLWIVKFIWPLGNRRPTGNAPTGRPWLHLELRTSIFFVYRRTSHFAHSKRPSSGGGFTANTNTLWSMFAKNCIIHLLFTVGKLRLSDHREPHDSIIELWSSIFYQRIWALKWSLDGGRLFIIEYSILTCDIIIVYSKQPDSSNSREP